MVLGDTDGAIQDFTRAIEVDPKNCAVAYFNRAVLLYKKGEFEKVIADCDDLLRLKPQNAEAYCLRGCARGARGSIDPAIADFTRAIKLDPKLALAYYNRGHDYYRRGEYDKAIADYTETIKLNAKYAEAFYGRGSPTRKWMRTSRLKRTFSRPRGSGYRGSSVTLVAAPPEEKGISESAGINRWRVADKRAVRKGPAIHPNPQSCAGGGNIGKGKGVSNRCFEGAATMPFQPRRHCGLTVNGTLNLAGYSPAVGSLSGSGTVTRQRRRGGHAERGRQQPVVYLLRRDPGRGGERVRSRKPAPGTLTLSGGGGTISQGTLLFQNGLARNVTLPYYDATVNYSTTDLVSNGLGGSFGQGRSWTSNAGWTTQTPDSAGYHNGTGWIDSSLPTLQASPTGPRWPLSAPPRTSKRSTVSPTASTRPRAPTPIP